MPLDRHTRDLFYCRIISALSQQIVANDVEALTLKTSAGRMHSQLAERLLLFFHQAMLDIKEKYENTAAVRRARRAPSVKPTLPTVQSNDNTNNSADEAESEQESGLGEQSSCGDIMQDLGSSSSTEDNAVMMNGDASP